MLRYHGASVFDRCNEAGVRAVHRNYRNLRTDRIVPDLLRHFRDDAFVRDRFMLGLRGEDERRSVTRL